MDGVEHVKIGKYVFPLYSHPLLRARLREEAYVQKQIEEQLRDPRLQHVINEVVDELLRQGITDNLREEDTAVFIERALARLDTFYQPREEGRSGTHLPPPRQGPASNAGCTRTLHGSCSSSNDKGQKSHNTPKGETVKILRKLKFPPRRMSPSTQGDGCSSSCLTRSAPLPALRNVRKQQQRMKSLQKQKETESEGTVKTNDVGKFYGPVAVPWQRFLPSYTEGDGGTEQVATTSQGGEEEEENESQRRGLGKLKQDERLAPPLPVGQAPPEWRNAVRTLFYSMISLRLEESGGVQPEEMDLRSGAQSLLKLQGTELDSLSQHAFGALDVTMDGNSYPIHCRTKVEPSIIQCSRIQQAEKDMKLQSNILRRGIISAPTRANATSSTSKGYIRIAGASLKHPWLNNSDQVRAATPVQSSNNFELPSSTYRSRVLGSVLQNTTPHLRMGGVTCSKTPSQRVEKTGMPLKAPPRKMATVPATKGTATIPLTASEVSMSASKPKVSKPKVSKPKVSESNLEVSGERKITNNAPQQVLRRMGRVSPANFSSSSSSMMGGGDESVTSSPKRNSNSTDILAQTSPLYSFSSDSSVHPITNDNFSLEETPRKMIAVHDMDTTESRRGLYINSMLLNGKVADLETVSPIQPLSNHVVASLFRDHVEQDKHEANAVQGLQNLREPVTEAVVTDHCIVEYEENQKYLTDQLFMAEEHIAQLTWEVARVRVNLVKVESTLFTQHAARLYNELEEVRQELGEEKASRKYHEGAHLAALEQLSKLRENMDESEKIASLLGQNAELKARIDDITRGKNEQELTIAELKEEVCAVKRQLGSSSWGSEQNTICPATSCAYRREELNTEAEYRTVLDGVSQLMGPKSMSFVTTSLPDILSPDIVRKLQGETHPINSTSHTSSACGVSGWQEKKQERASCGPTMLWRPRTAVEMQSDKASVSERLRGQGIRRIAWRKLLAPDGRTMYYNVITSKSTFKLPTEPTNF